MLTTLMADRVADGTAAIVFSDHREAGHRQPSNQQWTVGDSDVHVTRAAVHPDGAVPTSPAALPDARHDSPDPLRIAASPTTSGREVARLIARGWHILAVHDDGAGHVGSTPSDPRTIDARRSSLSPGRTPPIPALGRSPASPRRRRRRPLRPAAQPRPSDGRDGGRIPVRRAVPARARLPQHPGRRRPPDLRRDSRWPDLRPRTDRRPRRARPARIGRDPRLPDAGRQLRPRAFLLEALEGQVDKYDFVFLDRPPSLGLLTINAFCAASEVLVVISMTDRNAYKGAMALMNTIATLRRKKVDIEVTAVLRNNVDPHRSTYRLLSEALLAAQLPLLSGEIPMRPGFQNAVTAGVPLVHFAPDHPGTEAMRKVASELLEMSRLTRTAE
ncbi:MAG TPA: ParA family protein [Solirubrobacteraceae bacterium]|nr:ParA family protein [Solirubrobacteraceae bacterium]